MKSHNRLGLAVCLIIAAGFTGASCSTVKTALSVPVALVDDLSDPRRPLGFGPTSAQQREAEVFYWPTPPVGVSRPISENEPIDSVVLAMPLHHVSDPAVLDTFSQLISKASQVVPVVVLTEENVSLSSGLVRTLVEERLAKRGETLADERVRFFQSPLETIWIRDFGPVFGLSKRDRLVVIDNSYRDLRNEAQFEREFAADERARGTWSQFETVLSVERLLHRMNTEPVILQTPGTPHSQVEGLEEAIAEDEVRNMLAIAPEKRIQQSLSSMRRMLIAAIKSRGAGGRAADDLVPTYIHNLLSRQTNDKVIFERSPAIIWGGDFAASEDGTLVTTWHTLLMNGGDRDYFERLCLRYYGVRRIVYLEELPGTIAHVDMFFKFGRNRTLLLADLGSDWTGYDLQEVAELHRRASAVLERNRVALQRAFPHYKIIRVPIPKLVLPDEEQIPRILALASIPGIDRLSSSQRIALARFLNESPGDDFVTYLTYLNAVVLRPDRDDPGTVIVPRYARCTEYEARVREAYVEAFPGSVIDFVNADSIAHAYGALHCITTTIPRQGRRPTSGM